MQVKHEGNQRGTQEENRFKIKTGKTGEEHGELNTGKTKILLQEITQGICNENH